MNITVTKDISTNEKEKEAFLEPFGDVWIHLRELRLRFVEQSINMVFEESEKGFFGSHWGLRW